MYLQTIFERVKSGWRPPLLSTFHIKWYNFWFERYQKDFPYWNCDINGDGLYNQVDDDGPSHSDGSYEVVRDFACEYGPQTRHFNELDNFTQNLQNSTSVGRIRERYYREGQAKGFLKASMKFGPLEFGLATLDAPFDRLATHILGSYSYRIERRGSLLYFRIRNPMTRESGSRLPGQSYPDGEALSVEEILTDPGLYGTLPIESGLKQRTREETDDPMGGGNMMMIIHWHERYDPCFFNIPTAP